MSTVKIGKFADFVQHGNSEVVNPLNGEVVRKFKLLDSGEVHVDACDGATEITVPGDTPVEYVPWSMDRGSLVFTSDGKQLKACTELDVLVAVGTGDRFSISPAEGGLGS